MTFWLWFGLMLFGYLAVRFWWHADPLEGTWAVVWAFYGSIAARLVFFAIAAYCASRLFA